MFKLLTKPISMIKLFKIQKETMTSIGDDVKTIMMTTSPQLPIIKYNNIEGVYRLSHYQIIQDFKSSGCYAYHKNMIKQDHLKTI